MNIYVDFDDCLCETGRYFAGLAQSMFGRNVAYEDMRFFALKETFSLTDEQLAQLLEEGHRPEVLLGFEETPGAVRTLNSWIDSGHNVSVITGRPYSAWEPSREWLDRHGLGRARLYCLNKYGRDGFYKDFEYSLELEDYYRMRFDFAVEDSPTAFRFFDHLPEMKVLVFDRPWNRECEFPRKEFIRCCDWDTIRDIVKDGTPDAV